MDYTAEVQTKLEQLRALMAEKNLDAVWLRTVNNVAWITGGIDAAVNTADTDWEWDMDGSKRRVYNYGPVNYVGSGEYVMPGSDKPKNGAQ